jgi:hypothetical protein
MTNCLHCGKPTDNPKFCSKNCAATVNNRGIRRYPVAHRGFCRNCGNDLRSGQFAYCSESCSQEGRRALTIARWLETGTTRGVVVNPTIRTHILAEQDGCCAICGMAREWNGMPLVFVLDHIDGNSSDNSRGNVRLICPNCDSQLPTYKARNRGNGRFARRVRYANGQSF